LAVIGANSSQWFRSSGMAGAWLKQKGALSHQSTMRRLNLEQNQNSRALAKCLQGGFFWGKRPL
jgi:hypothetical protein